MNINTVKSLTELIVNKAQSGMLSPDRFNLAAESVNWEYYNFNYGQPVLSKNGQQVNDMFYASTEKIVNNLRPFIVPPYVLQIDPTGKAIKPADYVQTSSMRVAYGSLEIEADYVLDSDIGEYLGGELMKPTKRNPIHVIYNDRIQFYPKDLQRAFFTYLRKPRVPFWAFTIVNSRPVYDPILSIDFEFPDECLNEIVVRIVKLWSINIRESEVGQYAQSQIMRGS